MIQELFNLFLIISALHGILFFAVILFSKYWNHKSILYINFLVLAIALNNLQSWLLIKNYLPTLNDYQIPWHFLIAPFFYQFLISYLKIETKFSYLFSSSIIVFLLMIIIKIIGITHFFDNELATKYSYFEELFSLVISISIFFYAFHILSKKENLFLKILSFDNLRWLYTFFKLGLFSYIFWIIALSITIALNFSSYIYAYYPLRIFTTILIYWIGFQSIKQLRILNERQLLRNAGLQRIQQEITSDDYQNSEKITSDFEKLKAKINTDLLFAEPKLTVELLANKLHLSPHKLTAILKENSTVNFNDFINEFRVAYAKQLLLNTDFKNYTITAIGLEAGFNSKSSFYAIFKKFTNHTPLDFQKKAVQNS